MSIKSHLARVGDGCITTTWTLVRYWWRRLNTILFDKLLKEPTFIVCQSIDLGDTHARCHELVDGNVKIAISSEFNSKREFLSVLAHEMVHQWQYQIAKAVDHHGKSFWRWRWRFKKHGLALLVSY